jgi:hemolysin activation/secretion protein
MFWRYYWRCFVPLLIVITSAWGCKAQADEASRLKQNIDQQEQERRERRQEELRAPFNAPELVKPKSPDINAKGPCFPIQTISIQPADILPAHKVQKIIEVYQGRCLDSAALGTLQGQLNQLAMSQGLVTTRVLIPEQNLTEGQLKLIITPGTIENIHALSLTGMEKFMATVSQPGDILQMRVLEQSIDNLNRLASFKATIALLPGDAVNSTRVDLNVARQSPWQAELAWQGSALMADQPTQSVRSKLTLDSPLKLADRLIIGINSSLAEGKLNQAYGSSVDYDLPVGMWRFSLSADRQVYANDIAASNTIFQSSGHSRSWRSELSRMMLRDQKQRVMMALTHRQRINDNFMNHVRIGISSYQLQADALRVDYSWASYPWLVDMSVSAEHAETASQAISNPFTARYERYSLNGQLRYQQGKNSVSVSLNGQVADARLAPSEELSLTGQVAAYEPYYLGAAKGVALQTEWRRIFQLHALPLQFGLGAAWAVGENTGAKSAHLSSAMARVILPWSFMVSQIKIAKALSQPVPDELQLDASLSFSW